MNVTFEPGEEIIMTANKHWFVFVSSSLPFLLLIILPLILIAVFSGIFKMETYTGGSSPALFFATLWYLALWIAFFVKWTDYYLDVFILTNKRVIYISQKGLFSRRISSTSLDRVQDVSAEASGMMETFLHYGNVHVQTAGEEQEFTLHGLPNPNVVKDKILFHYDAAVRAPAEVVITEKKSL